MTIVLRVLTIYILLDYCYNALGDTQTSEEGEVENVDREGNQQKLLGIDYYYGHHEDENREDDGADKFDLELLNRNKEITNKAEIVYLDTLDTENYEAEMKAGNKAEILGSNAHYYQPDAYPDFSRRFVLQYPYTEVGYKNEDEIKTNKLTPKLADPELVLAVAEKSMLLDAAKPNNPRDDIIKKDILRTGNYWNSFWKEDIDPLLLRTKKVKKLEAIQADIPPRSKLYNVALKLKEFSPTLLYVINEKI